MLLDGTKHQTCFIDVSKPGSFSSIMKVALHKLLFDDLTHLGDFFISIDLMGDQFISG
jgi:hypothetical protein